MLKRRTLFALAAAGALGCGGKTEDSSVTVDSCATCVDTGTIDSGTADTRAVPPDVVDAFDTGSIFDAGPGACSAFPVEDPKNPPIECGPVPGTPKCSSTSDVATCPADSACMARAKPAGAVLDFRVGRLRFYAPEALLSLTPLAFDPNVDAKCENNGAESLNWAMRFDTSAKTLLTGGAAKSTDGGTTFAMSHASIDASALDSICPGFKGPATPIKLDPVSAPFVVESDGRFTSSAIPKLAMPIFEGTVPMILPLSDVVIKQVRVSTDGACIGAWDRAFWCDGDTLGWTTAGAIQAKILVEDADHVPIKSAGCQSLCAILVNDASKVTGKLCKRGADGKIPPVGDTTVTTTNDAFFLSTTFAAYAVKLVP